MIGRDLRATIRPSTVTRSPASHALEHVSPDPHRLVYAVFLGSAAHAFDPRALSIVQQAHLRIGGYIVEAAIIGQSHFVRCSDHRGRALAVEILSFVEPSHCGGRPTRVEPYGDGHIRLAETDDAIEIDAAIRTDHRPVTGTRGVPRPPVGESGAVLVHCFPGPAAPRTLVSVRADPRPANPLRWATQIRIDTVHEYVLTDRVAVVTSETTITIAEGL